MKPKFFKWILIYSLLALTVAIFLPIGNTGASAAPKEIDLATNPSDYLFNISNIKPGDWADRTLTVQNKGNQDFKYTVKTSRKSGSEKLYSQLALQVSDVDGILYDGKLGDFNGFKPRPLASFDQEDLRFKVTFPWESGNEFQGLATSVALRFVVEGDLPASTEQNGTPSASSGAQPNSNSDFPLLGSILPQTGETDPAYFYIAGLIIVLGGLALFTVKRRPHRK